MASDEPHGVRDVNAPMPAREVSLSRLIDACAIAVPALAHSESQRSMIAASDRGSWTLAAMRDASGKASSYAWSMAGKAIANV